MSVLNSRFFECMKLGCMLLSFSKSVTNQTMVASSTIRPSVHHILQQLDTFMTFAVNGSKIFSGQEDHGNKTMNYCDLRFIELLILCLYGNDGIYINFIFNN